MNSKTISQIWEQAGLPVPLVEFVFHRERKWRFDFAFPDFEREVRNQHGDVAAILTLPEPVGGVAIEVQGGIWRRGRHTRGAALKKEWEKLNTAAALGWRILYCEPREVCSTQFIEMIRATLNL